MAAPLVGLVAVWLARLFTFETAKYLAMRTMLIALVMGLGPIVIFKGFSFIMKFLGTYGVGVLNDLLASVDLQPQIVTLYGMGGYLASHFRLAEALSIYLSFLLLKFTWGLMPKWGVPLGLTKY